MNTVMLTQVGVLILSFLRRNDLGNGGRRGRVCHERHQQIGEVGIEEHVVWIQLCPQLDKVMKAGEQRGHLIIADVIDFAKVGAATILGGDHLWVQIVSERAPDDAFENSVGPQI